MTQPLSSYGQHNSVQAIIDRHHSDGGELISMLEDIQGVYGYLPREALERVSAQTGRAMVDVYGAATFHRAFSLEPRGKHLVSVCLGTACHVRGGARIAEALESELGICAGETTDDLEFTLETVNCLGACALGPIVLVDGHYFSNVARADVADIIAKTRRGLDHVVLKSDQRVFPLEVSCPRCNHGLNDPLHLIDGYPSIRLTVSYNHQHASLRLSSLYGSYAFELDDAIPEASATMVFCPHCHAQLNSGAECADCRANRVPLIVKGGGHCACLLAAGLQGTHA